MDLRTTSTSWPRNRLLDWAKALCCTGLVFLQFTCSALQTGKTTTYSQNRQSDVIDGNGLAHFRTYVGEQNYQHLVETIGDADLSLLVYGLSSSNAIALVNGIADIQTVTLLLSDPDKVAPTVIVDLLNQLDWHLINLRRYPQAIPDDTLGKVYKLVNKLTFTNVSNTIALKKIINGILPNPSDPQGFSAIQRLALLLALTDENQDLLRNVIHSVVTPADAYSADGKDKLLSVVNNTNSMYDLAALINGARVSGTPDVSKITYLLNNLSLADVAKIHQLINGTSDNTPATPNMERLLAVLNGANDIDQLRILIAQTVDTSKLVLLVNQVANINSLISLLNQPISATATASLLNALGDANKLVPLLDNVSPAKLAFLVNNMVTPQEISEVLNGITLSDVGSKLVFLVNGVTGVDAANHTAGSRHTGMSGLGKLVNLIEYSDNKLYVSDLLANLMATKIANLTDIVNQVPTNNLLCLLNAASATGYTTPTDLPAMLNALEAHDYPKLVTVLNNIDQCNGSNENSITTQATVGGVADDIILIAQLLGGLGGTDQVGQGLGHATLVTLFSSLPDISPNREAASGNLAMVLNQVNPTITYNGGAIDKREAFVRLLSPLDVKIPGYENSGIIYSSISFPGIGGVHVATMMTNVANATDLIYLLNTNDLSNIAVLVGCVDRVGDPNPSTAQGIDNLHPDFYTPCNAVGAAAGWVP